MFFESFSAQRDSIQKTREFQKAAADAGQSNLGMYMR
jgi:hypothetical protein